MNATQNPKLKLVFCGTPQFAVPTLEALLTAGHEIALVVTQPDRPVGRKQELHAPPVKEIALANGLPVVQPEKIRNNPEFQKLLEEIAPDAIIVVAYGCIIPPWMLRLPKYGCINLHASLLPKYRGAAPIQWAVANGERVTGNTTMLLEEGLDTGPILWQQYRPIAPEQTSVELFDLLATSGADLLLETLNHLQSGTITPTVQDHSQATLAPILTREDGRINFTEHTATQIFNRWRGFQPWPGAWTLLDGKKLIIHRMAISEQTGNATPGQIIIANHRIFVACASNTWIELLELQLEGKKRMTAAEFLRGVALTDGTLLGRERQ